ncbi:lipid-A-disaccharide synthase [Helicobacter sp. T3_23-1059]
MKILLSALEPSSNLHAKEVILCLLKNLYQQEKKQSEISTKESKQSDKILQTKENPQQNATQATNKIELLGIFDKTLQKQVAKKFAIFLEGKTCDLHGGLHAKSFTKSHANICTKSSIKTNTKSSHNYAKTDFAKIDPAQDFTQDFAQLDFAKSANDFIKKHLSFKPLFFSQDFAIMGFVDVAKKIVFILQAQSQLLQIAKDADKILFLDSSSFHIPLAKKIKSSGIKTPIYYYILPQVWAWKKWRVKVLERVFDRLLAILPFEVGYYSIKARESKKICFVGHPLLDELDFSAIKQRESQQKEAKSMQDFAQKQGLMQKVAKYHKDTTHSNAQSNTMRIVFMPGSRVGEIARIFPTFREVANALESKMLKSSNVFDTAFCITKSKKSTNFANATNATNHAKTSTKSTQNPKQNLKKDFIKILVVPAFFGDKSREELELIYGDLSGFELSFDTQDSLKKAHFAFICSGTATLEAALLGIPFVLCYKAARLDYLIARTFVKLRYIGLANIFYNALCGEEAGRGESKMHQELIQGDMTTKNLLNAFECELERAKDGHFITSAKKLWKYLSAKNISHISIEKNLAKTYYGSAQNVANMLMN